MAVDTSMLHCKKCDGMMHTKDVKKHGRAKVIFLIIIGGLFCLTVIGALIGVPIIIFAVRLGSETEHRWVCEKCGYQEKAG